MKFGSQNRSQTALCPRKMMVLGRGSEKILDSKRSIALFVLSI